MGWAAFSWTVKPCWPPRNKALHYYCTHTHTHAHTNGNLLHHHRLLIAVATAAEAGILAVEITARLKAGRLSAKGVVSLWGLGSGVGIGLLMQIALLHLAKDVCGGKAFGTAVDLLLLLLILLYRVLL